MKIFKKLFEGVGSLRGKVLLVEANDAGANYCIPKVELHGDHLQQLIKIGREQQIALKTMADSGSNWPKPAAKLPTGRLEQRGEYRGQLSATTIPCLMRTLYLQQ